MASTLLSFSLLLNLLFCLVHYFNSLTTTENTAQDESNQLKSDPSTRDVSPRAHFHPSSSQNTIYTPTSSQSSTTECDNPECPTNKGTDSTELSPEQQIFAQLGTIKEILDTLPETQRGRINGFLGTLESRRFEEDLPTTYASLSRQNKETSESDVIRAYQQFKEYRFEEVAVDDVDVESEGDRPRKGAETGVDKILAEFARAREIREKSHLLGTLLLEDALESMRDRDKRMAFGRYGVDKPKRRKSMIDPGLDAIEEIATPMAGSPFVGGIGTPGKEIGPGFELEEDMGREMAKRRMEDRIERSGELVEEDEGEEERSFI